MFLVAHLWNSCEMFPSGFDYKTCNVLLAMEEPDPEMSPSHLYHEADSVENENDPAGDQVWDGETVDPL